MAVYIGQASIDENGGIKNGKAGTLRSEERPKTQRRLKRWLKHVKPV